MTRPFIDTLRELRAGKTLDELAEHLQELVAAVRTTGRAGTLTITIKVGTASRGDHECIMLRDEIKTKIPQGERAATLFFATPENNLTRRQPRQGDLPGLDDEVEIARTTRKAS